MNRRDFVTVTAATSAAALAGVKAAAQQQVAAAVKPFKMKYAPHFGMFANHAADDLDQVSFAADEGFLAWEDNGMMGRDKEFQEKFAAIMSKRGMTMGIFVAADIDWRNPTLTTGKAEHRDKFLDDCKKAVDVAKRVNATHMTVVPGTLDPRLDIDYQNANVIDVLRSAAEIFEPHKLVMVLEALNHRHDHPGLYLTTIAQGFMICRAVNSPSCKILYDMYHQQITEGNIIPNIDMAWSEIGYYQIGDNPGRNEPGSGEVNWRNVFKHLHEKGYAGVLGMEHGNSQPGKEGERKVIDAYRAADEF